MLQLWHPFLPTTKAGDKRASLFDRLLENPFDWAGFGLEHKKNEDGTLTVSVDIPGIKEGDITIECEDDVVYVRGERKTTTSSYSVSKSFSIPEGYKSDDVKADLDNGVLSLTLQPKQLPQKEIKKIPISSKK